MDNIWESFEARSKAVFYPANKEFREKRDAEYRQTPIPSDLLDAAKTPSLLRKLLEDRDLAHKQSVTDEIRGLRKEYDAKIAVIETEFREALAKAYLQNPNHPKESTLWDMAWSEGHADGYSSVESHYEDLSQLLN